MYASVEGDANGAVHLTGDDTIGPGMLGWWFDAECVTKPFLMWACAEALGLDAEVGGIGSVRAVLAHETTARFPSALEWLFSPDDLRAEMRLAITRGDLRTDQGYSEVASTIALLAATFGPDVTSHAEAVSIALNSLGLPPSLVCWAPLDDSVTVIPSSECIATSPYFPTLCAGYTRKLGPEFGGLMRLDRLAEALSAQCRSMRDQSVYGRYLAASQPDYRWDETWNRVARFVGGWELTDDNQLTLRSPASGIRVVLDRGEESWRIELHE